MPGAYARFDDLRSPGRAFELIGHAGSVSAALVTDVAGVLQAAEQAALDGFWVAGFVSYEASPGLDNSLEVGRPLANVPLAWFGLFRDRVEVEPVEPPTGATYGPWALNWDPSRHAAAIGVIKDEIAAGNVYQVNLTLRASAAVGHPAEHYKSMAHAQGGAYCSYLSSEDWAVLSGSPELFFDRHGERIITKPMKGTRRRGRWQAEDGLLARDLVCSPKERAEHIMIVDLLRNDLGRVCRPGTITVERLLEVERYPAIWQLTSTISGRLQARANLLDIFRALFPGGSVTGAPKGRAMGVIASLEQCARGPYCGSIGFIEPGAGSAVFSVGIRTAVVDIASAEATYGCGGAIVWDSSATAEWDELVAKCSVLEPPVTPRDLLETLRVEPPDRPVHLDGHLHRLEASARYFGIPFDRRSVINAIAEAISQPWTGSRCLRIKLAPSGAVAAELSAMPRRWGRPARLAVPGARVSSSDVNLFHKCADRRFYTQLRDAAPDADDVLLVNERDEVTEATTANVAVQLEGHWYTPPLTCGLLPGVERARLLSAGRLQERVISLGTLRSASSVALFNSLRGWAEAQLVEAPCAPADRPLVPRPLN